MPELSDECILAARENSNDAGVLLGLDMGGSLIKMTFLESHCSPTNRGKTIVDAIYRADVYGDVGIKHSHLTYEDYEMGGTVHFITWLSERVEDAVAYIKVRGLHACVSRIVAAGGGAQKHAKLFKDELDIELVSTDELKVVVRAVSWLTYQQEREVYEIVLGSSPSEMISKRFWKPTCLFPYLLVNIGTGVSIVKVTGHKTVERVSGSAMGGGTFLGLCRLLTDCESWDQAMDLASTGDANKVNLLVEDIYGGDYTLPNGSTLPGSLTASFFGKVGTRGGTIDKESMLAALTIMVSQNICQVAYLNARIHKTNRVIFTGNYLRLNKIAEKTIAHSFKRASIANPGGEEMRALFLTHEGYFGALGSLLESQEIQIAETCGNRPRIPSVSMSRTASWIDYSDTATGCLRSRWHFDESMGGIHVLASSPFVDHHDVSQTISSTSPAFSTRGIATKSDFEDNVIASICRLAGLHIFCSSLVKVDTSALIMDLVGQDPQKYAKFASRQASLEKIASILAVGVACTCSDKMGRRPVQVLSGGLVGLLWNLFLIAVPLRPGSAGARWFTLASIGLFKALHAACLSIFLAVKSCSLEDICEEDPSKLAAASARTQIVLGSAVVLAPQVAVALRRIHQRAPFAACALLWTLSWVLTKRLPETLPITSRTRAISWADVLNPFASSIALFREGSRRLRLLLIGYCMVSLTHCSDHLFEAFLTKRLGWTRVHHARCISFWGLTMIVGSQCLKGVFKRCGPDMTVQIGTIFLTLQELAKSMTSIWWHMPAAFVVGLPSAGLEPALKALIAREARSTTNLNGGAVQVALRNQQAFMISAIGNPIIGTAFDTWASRPLPPKFARHYVLSALAAFVGGGIHASCNSDPAS